MLHYSLVVPIQNLQSSRKLQTSSVQLGEEIDQLPDTAYKRKLMNGIRVICIMIPSFYSSLRSRASKSLLTSLSIEWSAGTTFDVITFQNWFFGGIGLVVSCGMRM